MIRHLLGHLELSAVSKVLRDPGGAEAVAGDPCAYAGVFGAPADHAVYVLLRHGKVRELARSSAGGAEKKAFTVRVDPGPVDIGLQVFFKRVVAGHIMALAALFMKAHPGAPALRKTSSTRIRVTAPTRAKV